MKLALVARWFVSPLCSSRCEALLRAELNQYRLTSPVKIEELTFTK